MKIQINHDSEFEVTGTAQEMLSQLNETIARLYSSNEIVQEVIIDGQPYSEGYETYLYQHIGKVRNIQLMTVNGDLWIAELVTELQHYLPKLIKATDSISDCFYGQMAEEDWRSFSQLMEGVTWVYQSVQTVRNHHANMAYDTTLNVFTAAMVGFTNELEQLLPQVERSIEQQEFTNAGDLLKYELGTALERLSGALAANRGTI